jgi:hypothetical protein
MTNFAVETQGQHARLVAKLVIEVASESGYIFKHLAATDKLVLGSVEYQGFRVANNITVTKLMDALLTKGRAVIGPGTGGFVARVRGKVANVPFSLMQAAPRSQVQYRGPGDQYWQRQFD